MGVGGGLQSLRVSGEKGTQAVSRRNEPEILIFIYAPLALEPELV